MIPLIDKTSHAAYMKNEYDWIVEKCGKLSIEVLDLRNVFEGHRVKKLAIFPNDVCHFNKFGNQLIASAIYEYLKGKSSPLSQP